MRAVIVAGHGTVVLRNDGSVAVTNRNRETVILSDEICRAVVGLVREAKRGDDVPAGDDRQAT